MSDVALELQAAEDQEVELAKRKLDLAKRAHEEAKKAESDARKRHKAEIKELAAATGAMQRKIYAAERTLQIALGGVKRKPKDT